MIYKTESVTCHKTPMTSQGYMVMAICSILLEKALSLVLSVIISSLIVAWLLGIP